MFTAFLLLCAVAIALAILLDRTDAREHAIYHRLQPVEEGCVHEVEHQLLPTTSMAVAKQCACCNEEPAGWEGTPFCCIGCATL
jgi:hypothetical protein